MATERIVCPKCGEHFPLESALTESIRISERATLQEEIDAAHRREEVAKGALSTREAEIENERAALQSQVATEVAKQRPQVEAQIRDQLSSEYASQLEAQGERNTELMDKLKEAQTAQSEAMKAKQKAELKAQSVDVEVDKRVSAQAEAIKTAARAAAEETSKFKILELQKKLQDTTNKLSEAQRRAEQGSQQLQGEVFELNFESILSHAFPEDEIEAVKKGQRGGDCVQRLKARVGKSTASILWETKTAQKWAKSWLEKAKRDAHNAKADVVVIVSTVLPKDVDHFGLSNGVWVTDPGYAVQLGGALREGVLQAHSARRAAKGRATKATRMYDYLTGPEFASRLHGIAEPFIQMKADLDSERRTLTQRWNKREKLLDRVLEAAFGMRGDLAALAGSDLKELEGIELEALAPPVDPNVDSDDGGNIERKK
ncbi:MAG: DUF2130 domain-containing protein [Armatimonadetes bacterium]|nr:DUF2130 domain-containing protein [Armatimonadota bacterium]